MGVFSCSSLWWSIWHGCGRSFPQMCSLVGTQGPAVRSMQARGALVWALQQPQLLTQVTHSVAGTWEPRPPSLLVGLVEIKSFSERPVAAGSSHLPKPGLHPAVSASAQLGWTSWSSLPRWPNPLQALFGAGQSKGLLGQGTSPEELGCDESRVKPSPASVRACEIKTQKGRDQTRLFPRCSSSKLAPQGWEEAAQGTGRH